MFRELIEKLKESRLFLMGGIFVVLACILVHRLFVLQIIRGEEYLENYQLSIEKTKNIPATRGNIYDTNGKLLAYNDLAYTVKIEDVYESSSTKNAQLNSNIYTLIKMIEKNGDNIVNDFNIVVDDAGNYAFDVSGSTLLRFKADIYGEAYVEDLTYEQQTATAEEMMEYLAGTSRFAVGAYEYDEEGNRVRDEEGKYVFHIGEGYTKEEVLQIVTIRYALYLVSYQVHLGATVATDISEETVAVIMENMDELQGVSIEEDTVRRYVDSTYFSQILGYTGKISSTELESLNAQLEEAGEEAKYTSSDVVGKSGIEQYMELELHGTNGYEKVYVDKMGRLLDTEERVEPVSGNDIYLTIDADLQKATMDILEQSVAGILIDKIENIKTFTLGANQSSDKLVIPIYDVYFALFDNNVISISLLNAEDAGEVEKEVYAAFQSFSEERIEKLKTELYSTRTAYKSLSEEYQTYQGAMIELLKAYDVLDMDVVDTSDETYIKWVKEETISMAEFLEYCIAQNWINVGLLNLESDYADSKEIFDKLVDYMFEIMGESSSFRKYYYKYMLLTDTISGVQVCKLLCEQKCIDTTMEDVDALYSGSISSYQFMINRIQNLDITPAQLALDPYAGSVVVTDPNSGNVLALVSYPSIDNNLMANTVNPEYYAKIQADKSNPQYNYATQQRSAPGSTFKMISTVAALEEGILSPTDTINCVGVFDRFAQVSRCWIYPGSHGPLYAAQAIRHSCNYYFYEVGYRLSLDEEGKYDAALGLEKLAKYADVFGLTDKSGVEIAESSPQVSTELPVLSAIGQGTNSYTTVGLARYVTTIANNGTCYNLTLLDKMTDSEGKLIEEFEASVRNQVEISQSIWDAIHTGMKDAAASYALFNQLPVIAAGKTGTAQENTKRADHALFVGYAPYENPEIAVSARICFGYSSGFASQVGYKVMEYYFAENKEDVVTDQAIAVDPNSVTNEH